MGSIYLLDDIRLQSTETECFEHIFHPIMKKAENTLKAGLLYRSDNMVRVMSPTNLEV